MASEIERTYPANVKAIGDLMKSRGITIARLAQDALISDRTLKRLLNEGRQAFLATYAKIAKALGVTDVSTLYIDPNAVPTAPRIDAPTDVTIDDDPQTFDETLAEEIAAAIAKRIGAKVPVRVIAIILNSVTLRIGVAPEDIGLLVDGFARGDLNQFKVIRLKFLPSPFTDIRFIVPFLARWNNITAQTTEDGSVTLTQDDPPKSASN